MKFKINAKEFLNDIMPVIDVMPQHTTFPVLSNFLIEVKEKELIVFGTDLDSSVIAKVPAEIQSLGSAAISGKLVKNVLREISGDVTFERIENEMVVKYPGGEFSLSIIEREEYPEIPIYSSENLMEINMDYLKDSIDKTIFCVATEPTSRNLNGLYWLYNSNVSRMVGTDSFRMAIYSQKLKFNIDSFDVLIPPKILSQVISLPDKKVLIGIDKKKIYFVFDRYTFISKLINEKFPDYEKAIPQENDKIFKVKVKDLISSLRRVSVFSQDRLKSVIFDLGESLKLKSTSELGRGEENLKGEFQGESIQIGLSSQFLLEFLRKISSDVIEITMKESNTPVLVKDPKIKDLLYILMPVVI